jgi:hypothetical protein
VPAQPGAATESGQATAKPTDPTAKPTDPAAKPADPAARPADPAAAQEAAPGTKPAEPTAAGAADPAAAQPGQDAGKPAAPAGQLQRVYAMRGVARSGRPGEVSRIVIPVLPVAPPPLDLAARTTETAVVLEWKPNPAAPQLAFNVYRGEDTMQPLNAAPLAEPKFEDTGAAFGKEQCYRVRAAGVVDKVVLEGELSEPECVTPRDVFPPAAPKGLVVVATAGQISLIWDTNPEKDLAGYVVLRGDAGAEALQAVTPAPIKETSFTDTTVKPGVRYAYAIVAVDAADPANASAQSARVEETAR